LSASGFCAGATREGARLVFGAALAAIAVYFMTGDPARG
jgi:hypothetical protein